MVSTLKKDKKQGISHRNYANADYADDLVLLANTPNLPEFLQ